MKYLLFVIFSLFLFNRASFANTVAEESIKTLSQDVQWRLLLHFTHDWKEGDVSEVDGGDFFLSPQGRKDPEAELRATLAAAHEDRQVGPLKQHPLCAFKARYQFLSKKLGVQFPQRSCEKWDDFVSRFANAKNVNLIFSSAYTNNPASMFGHLFLRVGSSKFTDLLSTGVNFAAQVPPDENPLAFFTFGIAGGYEGHWSIQPYYEKLNEYIRSENRDLWEYELNLTDEEVSLFLAHLWELETTGRIDYYFFDDNCAYQMARIIEAVKPQWKLSHHTIYVIPGELVKNFFNSPEIVRDVRFRPALRKVLMQKYDVLSAQQKDQFFSIIDHEMDPTLIEDGLVLETSSSYMDYQRQIKKGILDPEEKKLWDQILSKRASLGKVNLPPMEPISEETRPDLGHDAYSVIPMGGMETHSDGSQHSFLGIKVKSAYHDLFNKDLGYKKYSEILFPWMEWKYRPDDKSFFLEELGGIKITSLTPISRIDFHPSWKMLFAFETPKDFGCIYCRHFVWEGGIGLSEEIFSSDHLLYQFLTLRAEADEDLPKEHRILPTFEAGWLSTIHNNWKIGLQFAYSQDIGAERLNDSFYRVSLNQSYSWARNWDIRQKFEVYYPRFDTRPTYSELRLDLSYYFR